MEDLGKNLIIVCLSSFLLAMIIENLTNVSDIRNKVDKLNEAVDKMQKDNDAEADNKHLRELIHIMEASGKFRLLIEDGNKK